MEGLFLLLAECVGVLLLGPFLSALGAAVELLGLLVGVALELLALLAAWRRRAAAAPQPLPEPARPRTAGRWPRGRVVLWSALGAGLVLVVLAQTVLFVPLLRLVLAGQDAVAVAFRSARGNLFTGQVVLEDVALRRDDPERGSFDLRVARLELDLDLTGWWRTPRTFTALTLAGVRGSYERDLTTRTPRRPFVVESLALNDVAVEVRLRRGEREHRFPLTMTSWHSAPWRSQRAALDAFLRTNATGGFAGQPFQIASAPVADAGGAGRETRCAIQDLPLDLLGTWLGGPLQVFTGGTASLDVVDQWLLGSDDRIDARCEVVLRGVRAELPAGLEGLSARLAAGVAAWLQRREQDTRLVFRLRLAGNELTADSSAAARALALGLLRALAESAGVDARLLDTAGAGVELFRWMRRRGK